ncbi:MAG: hypothetical protein RJA57_120 [Bacteroidota bacterium]
MLFFLWLGALSWLVTRIRFFRTSGLGAAQLVVLFQLKVIAGIFYGWIGLYYGGYAQMQDTWVYHMAGLQEYELLRSDPAEYFANLFRDPYGGDYGNFFGGHASYWNDLKGNGLIKLFSLMNPLSFGHYYVNVIFYSVLTLWGAVALYRVMRHAFPEAKGAVLSSTFLLPSFLYWTSGLHKEGMIFNGIALVVYCMYFGTVQGRWGWKRVVGLFTGLLILLVLRNVLFLLVIPALLAWWLAWRRPLHGRTIFASIYLACTVAFFTAPLVSPKLNLPQAVVNRQQDFLKLKPGRSNVIVKELEPNAVSFLKHTPQALRLSILRPHPTDVKHLLSLAASLEITLILLFFLLFLFWNKRPGTPAQPLLWFCLFYSFSVLMAIGFTSNNLGAVVRYRSVVLPLLIIPLAARFDWSRIGRIFKY